MTPMSHPPYSPNLTLSNTFVSLFLRMEKVLKEKYFFDVEEENQKTAEALNGIKINEFKSCFEQWKKCLQRHIASNGEDLEGDWSLSI